MQMAAPLESDGASAGSSRVSTPWTVLGPHSPISGEPSARASSPRRADRSRDRGHRRPRPPRPLAASSRLRFGSALHVPARAHRPRDGPGRTRRARVVRLQPDSGSRSDRWSAQAKGGMPRPERGCDPLAFNNERAMASKPWAGERLPEYRLGTRRSRRCQSERGASPRRDAADGRELRGRSARRRLRRSLVVALTTGGASASRAVRVRPSPQSDVLHEREPVGTVQRRQPREDLGLLDRDSSVSRSRRHSASIR